MEVINTMSALSAGQQHLLTLLAGRQGSKASVARPMSVSLCCCRTFGTLHFLKSVGDSSPDHSVLYTVILILDLWSDRVVNRSSTVKKC